MTPMTEEEWRRVQEALVKGGLRECIDDLLAARPFLHEENRKIIERAYDDGDGNNITLVLTDDYPWFAGTYEGSELYLGMEVNGILYSIVTHSGGLVSVVVGHALLDNEVGTVFPDVTDAKAHVKGLAAAT